MRLICDNMHKFLISHFSLEQWLVVITIASSQLDIWILHPKACLNLPSLEENKVFFTRKISEKIPQMATIGLDQGVILDKLF